MSVPRLVKRGARFYWQPTGAVRALGFEPEALGPDLARATRRAIELNDLVEAAREGRPLEAAPARTIGALIRSYRRSPAYLGRPASSRATYDTYLDRIDARVGLHPAAAIKRAELVRIYERLRADHSLHVANGHMAVWGILCRHAIDIGWRTDDPMYRFRLLKPAPRTRLWSRHELERFCAAAVERKRPSIALGVRLGHDTAQRLGDVLRLSWAHWDGTGLAIRQRKTGARILVPVSPEVRGLIVAAPRSSPVILTSEASGRPYGVKGFQMAFRAIRQAAGLDEGLQFRDLRRTAATELGRAGATHDEIIAITGHRSRDVVSVYVLPTGETARRGQQKRWKSERERNGKVGKPKGQV